MKYGIIQEQRGESFCERLENMFIDGFNLAQKNNQKGAIWITLGNNEVLNCIGYRDIQNLARNVKSKKKENQLENTSSIKGEDMVTVRLNSRFMDEFCANAEKGTGLVVNLISVLRQSSFGINYAQETLLD